ncbi:opsin 9 [Salminus brasiliensis]|uniref:opsin 9 n=1 Tax=Salminus brasiliensis TaxID=930266 RepID=UPI003B835E41
MSEGVNRTWRGFVSHPSSITSSFHSHLTPSTDLIVAIILIITGVVSVTGNGVVLLIHGRKRKKLRAHELMTINLAVCDFGYSLLGAPCVVMSSLSHGWILGDLGCLWYGFQGFVFGVGSLFTTCLISLDRCFKICSLRYGQWIERKHVSLSIGLMWAYTLIWASLPMFGFGSYSPEPYGTSCTINWWRMKSSLNDRIYIYLILLMCFVMPTLIILTSYIAILITVYRSGRTLASISSSSVSHGSSKDLRLTKIAAVVCSSFLIAWTPYAIVSFYSALTIKDEQEESRGAVMVTGMPGTGTEHTNGEFLDYLSLHSFINWTSTENYGDMYDSWRNVTPDQYGYVQGSTVGSNAAGAEHQGHRPASSLRPEVTLIPAIFAKSHCMINPFIYQIMNREFREDVYDMFCWGGESEKRRRRRRRGGSESDGFHSSISLSYSHIWRRRSTETSHSSGERGKKEEDMGKGKGQTQPWQDNTSSGCASLDATNMDTQTNVNRGQGSRRPKEKKKVESTSSSLLNYED